MGYQPGFDQDFKILTRLLRTLTSNPEVAQLVQNLHFDSSDDPRNEIPPPTCAPEDSMHELDIEQAVNFIKGTGADRTGDWVEAFVDGDLGAIVALVVSRLPNLESLEIYSDLEISSRYLGAMSTYALVESSDWGN
ncbi:hypothetical protein FZEAL_10015 [Fusarium zealandicum]|uniref:Uncharacterized protein n=1 Tax=Fusarium zealandicum TaxID=1053134 RepID=A0A8H4U6J0_9HYPO|nr:hypothetical protein FZEAL_10015 [Fusarium zealandicum]